MDRQAPLIRQLRPVLGRFGQSEDISVHKGLLGFSVRVPASQIISVKQARKSSSVKLIRQLLVWRKSVMVFIMNTVIFLSRLPIIIIIRHF